LSSSGLTKARLSSIESISIGVGGLVRRSRIEIKQILDFSFAIEKILE